MQEGGRKYDHKTYNFILYGTHQSSLANSVVFSVENMSMECANAENRM